MAGTALGLVPYLHFAGDCEEALAHYVSCLGGRLEGVQRYGDADMGMEIPEEYRNKVLHARLSFGDNVLMASDVFPGQPLETGSRVQLVLELTDEATTQRIFADLSAGGEVTMPLERQFWGALYGKLTDRFGIAWMLNCQLE